VTSCRIRVGWSPAKIYYMAPVWRAWKATATALEDLFTSGSCYITRRTTLSTMCSIVSSQLVAPALALALVPSPVPPGSHSTPTKSLCEPFDLSTLESHFYPRCRFIIKSITLSSGAVGNLHTLLLSFCRGPVTTISCITCTRSAPCLGL
jgi:hypothetical protein